MLPVKTIDTRQTADGELRLLQRGKKEFIIKLDNQILMNSHLSITEKALAEEAVKSMIRNPRPNVMLSGLGMGITLRAALDKLPPKARVTVAELNPIVVDWCKGPLHPLCPGALSDRRVKVKIENVFHLILGACADNETKFDAIILDLYEGVQTGRNASQQAYYGKDALLNARDALVKKGILALWTEQRDKSFEKRAEGCGFQVSLGDFTQGGPRHAVYILKK